MFFKVCLGVDQIQLGTTQVHPHLLKISKDASGHNVSLGPIMFSNICIYLFGIL